MSDSDKFFNIFPYILLITALQLFCYQVYNHTILINNSLNLPSIPSQSPDLTIFIRDCEINYQDVRWIHDYETDRDFPWHRLGKIGSDYLVRFTKYADFIISEQNQTILCLPIEGVQANTIEHLLLDQILPRVLSRKVSLVIHAGSVVTDVGAVGFVGKSGYGKSTLTTHLCENGFYFLTDDCLVLLKDEDKFLALPSYPTTRLKQEIAYCFTEDVDRLPYVAEYSSKLRYNTAQDINAVHERTEILKALFILDEPVKSKALDTVVINRCSPRDSFGNLVENVFRLDPTDKQSNIKEFENISTLLSTVPVYHLKYSRRLSMLDQVMQSISDLLCEPKGSMAEGSHV